MIEFPCAECGRIYAVPDHAGGRRCRCSACGTRQEIPFVLKVAAKARPQPVRPNGEGSSAEHHAAFPAMAFSEDDDPDDA